MQNQSTYELEQDFTNNRLGKYGITRKSIYSMASVLMCIILVVVLSLVQAGFDINKISQVAFWIEFAIMAGLSIFGMIGGQRSSDDIARNKPSGAFRKTLKKFSRVVKDIRESIIFAYLDDWLELYKEKRKQEKIKNFLKGMGIKQMEVLDLDQSELDLLKMPYKKDWSETLYKGKYKDNTTYFLSLSDEQIEAIKYVFSGGIKVSNLTSDYFTTAVNITDKDMWESAANEDHKKGLYLAVNYSYRLVMLLVICIVSTALTSGLFEETAAETILTLIKRIFTIMSAYVWGVFIGIQMVKIDLAYLEFKTNILTLFKTECDNGIYKHKEVDVMAREEYDNLIEQTKNQPIVALPEVEIKLLKEEENERGEENADNK